MASVQRVLSMSREVSSTVNAAVVDYLEASAVHSYERWDADAGPDERATLASFNDQP